MPEGRSENFQHIDKSHPKHKEISSTYFSKTNIGSEPGPDRPEDETNPETGMTRSEEAERRMADQIILSKEYIIAHETEDEKFFRFTTGITLEEALRNKDKLQDELKALEKNLETYNLAEEKAISECPPLVLDNLEKRQAHINGMGEVSRARIKRIRCSERIDWIKLVFDKLKYF